MRAETFSIRSCHGSKSTVEKAAQGIFTACGFFAVLAVASITLYMLISGTPALFKVGLLEILFGDRVAARSRIPQLRYTVCHTDLHRGNLSGNSDWSSYRRHDSHIPGGGSPQTAERHGPSGGRASGWNPLCHIRLLGILILNPLMYKMELILFKGSETHQFTGGANLISAVLVLALMILPTVINISESALRSVPAHLKSASLALGATKIQTIFQVIVPAAKSGIITAVVLGTGRAIGEAMAISLVSGSSVNLPLPFSSVRFLTTAIVSEMGYASGLHRQVLFTIGLVLFAFIMIINISLTRILKRGGKQE